MSPARQRQAFLLILLQDDAEPAVLRGRVRHIASETETAFLGADQLIAWLQAHNHAPAASDGQASTAPKPPTGET